MPTLALAILVCLKGETEGETLETDWKACPIYLHRIPVHLHEDTPARGPHPSIWQGFFKNSYILLVISWLGGYGGMWAGRMWNRGEESNWGIHLSNTAPFSFLVLIFFASFLFLPQSIHTYRPRLSLYVPPSCPDLSPSSLWYGLRDRRNLGKRMASAEIVLFY